MNVRRKLRHRCAPGRRTGVAGGSDVAERSMPEFDDALTTWELEAKVRELEHRVCAAHRGVVRVFVKPQSTAG
jgi:hypothetical protein